MHKSKWLYFDGARSQRALISALRQCAFDADSGRGFEVIYRSGDRLRSKFIERIATREAVTDPFGFTTEFETVRYATTVFDLHMVINLPYQYVLEVGLPPRSLRPLIAALESALDQVTVKEADLALLHVFGELKKSSPAAKVTRIKASQLRLTAESEAKVELVSIKDAHKDFVKAFGTAAKIDKLRIENAFGTGVGITEIARNGLVGHDPSVDDEVRSFMLGYLAANYERGESRTTEG
ncbi:hypothetical protein [Ideonella sp. YS5]|uniref:hypothetical protein n=1 Tax=Ideonella sp. YS5 TaxID=3453714 RepID=UPI003EE9E11B